MEEKRLTPIQAIHAYCVRCMGGNPNIVREQCTDKRCPLYTRRMGENQKDGLTPAKAIRAFCIECRGQDRLKDVEECTGRLVDGKCMLHDFRMGKNPNIKGNASSSERMAELRRMAAERKNAPVDV